jgi:hypothetical protein
VVALRCAGARAHAPNMRPAQARGAHAALAVTLVLAVALAPLAAALRLGALTTGSGTPAGEALHDGPAHVARAWATAPVVPGRLCPAGSVIGEYVRRHQLMHPPSDFGNGGGAGNAWMQRNWEPHLRCVGEVRMGQAGDGGKHVCDPECLLERGDCLVYSFGSNNDFGFESALLPFQCEMHVFDHTGAHIAPHAPRKDHGSTRVRARRARCCVPRCRV